jgi:hypothetical protein
MGVLAKGIDMLGNLSYSDAFQFYQDIQLLLKIFKKEKYNFAYVKEIAKRASLFLYRTSKIEEIKTSNDYEYFNYAIIICEINERFLFLKILFPLIEELKNKIDINSMKEIFEIEKRMKALNILKDNIIDNENDINDICSKYEIKNADNQFANNYAFSLNLITRAESGNYDDFLNLFKYIYDNNEEKFELNKLMNLLNKIFYDNNYNIEGDEMASLHD